uniref:Uncharacterized protein n=1 Tax=Anguilla anguilla TaxID=7936 RepID=A0A0E9X8X7_ANGAN
MNRKNNNILIRSQAASCLFSCLYQCNYRLATVDTQITI